MLQCVQGHVLVRSLPAWFPTIALLLLAFFVCHSQIPHAWE